MTIAVGFLCDNGESIVLASDQQITSRGAYKTHQRKFFQSKTDWFDMAFMYSGEPGTFNAFIDKLTPAIQSFDSKDLTVEAIQETVESVLRGMDIMGSFVDPQLWMLIAIDEIFGQPKLIVFNGRYVSLVRSEVAIIGCGDTSLIHFLADKLYSPTIDPQQGVALAAYLVKKATQYIDGAGEPIDVLQGGNGICSVNAEAIAKAVSAIENEEQFLPTLMIQKPFVS